MTGPRQGFRTQQGLADAQRQANGSTTVKSASTECTANLCNWSQPDSMRTAFARSIALLPLAGTSTYQPQTTDNRQNGASRARTDDLRAASATLSQLSYSPAINSESVAAPLARFHAARRSRPREHGQAIS